MLRRFIFIIIFFNFFSQCGFSPLHLNKTNANFSISDIKIEGDRTINNYLKTYLNQYRNNDYEKNFTLEINTLYEKKILSKDKSSKIANYELIATSTFKVYSKAKFIKQIIISEKKNMNSDDDKFEEQKYERIIKQNFALIISNKLATDLSIVNDN
tara:strand:- start:437 stop:904 length:468 start_codon:yes stop_codon:yes gene_type:complete